MQSNSKIAIQNVYEINTIQKNQPSIQQNCKLSKFTFSQQQIFGINIKFNYHKNVQFEGGLQSLRTISPTGFKTMGQFDSVCVYGYCYMRKRRKNFNLDRISDLIMNPNKIEFWSE